MGVSADMVWSFGGQRSSCFANGIPCKLLLASSVTRTGLGFHVPVLGGCLRCAVQNFAAPSCDKHSFAFVGEAGKSSSCGLVTLSE